MTYFKQTEASPKATANKGVFGERQTKLIPCVVKARHMEQALIEYFDSTGSITLWTNSENIIEQ